jgi:hypothetical protein
MHADDSDRAVSGVGPRPFACWDCGFEFRRGIGCLYLVSFLFCHVGLITRPEESYRMCGVSECDRETSTMRRLWSTRGFFAMGNIPMLKINLLAA